MPAYKLVYFNGKGRAETIRLAFHLGGIKFEDFRIEKSDWAELKPKTLTGQLPYLLVDGKELSESLAIARYVGREAGIMGKSNFEQAVIESIIDIINEMLEKSVNVLFCSDEVRKETLKKEFVDKHLVNTAKVLEKYLGNKKFLASEEITLADLHFFAIFDFLTTVQIQSWEVTFPKLKELSDRIANDPRLAEYLKNRPKTDF